MKKFVGITTSEYDGGRPGEYSVSEFTPEDYEKLGIDEEEAAVYEEMAIGDIVPDNWHIGAYVMRVV